ncbi:MAG: hypothetical protein ABI945_11915, partial [Nitrospirales bacterium]
MDLTFDGARIDSFDGSNLSEKINILLVDDNVNCLMALKEVLSGPDRHLVMVQSGEEALRYLLGADVGIVLLDIRLSGLSEKGCLSVDQRSIGNSRIRADFINTEV